MIAGREGPAGFRWLALVATAATYALVIVGGVVRTTDSGDACPDWPRCHGELLPPLDSHVLIEFSHRLLASLVGLLVVAMALAAWRWQRRAPAIVCGAVLAVVLVIAQIGLGGATVLSELSSNVVTAHLALAATLLATLLVVTVLSLPPRPAARRAADPSFRNLAVVAAVATFALMLTGSYVSGSGAGLAFRDWPLFDGQLLPEGGRLAMIHATHRFAALLVALLLAYLAVRAWRTQRSNTVVVTASIAAVVLYGAQALVGAANIWTLLQPAASTAHLALAMAIWALLVGVTALSHLGMQTERIEAAQPVEGAPARRAAGPLPAQRSS